VAGVSNRAAGSSVSSNSSSRHGVGEEEAVCRGIGFGHLLLPIVLNCVKKSAPQKCSA
jgi:hypothetical protein